MAWEWPLMWKSDHEAVRVENYTLRDALREANNEVRRYRTLIAEIKSGRATTIQTLEKVLNEQK